MIYVNFAKYIGDQDKIAQLRPKHRKYLADLLKCGRLAGAGPFTDGSGTLIIYNVETSGGSPGYRRRRSFHDQRRFYQLRPPTLEDCLQQRGGAGFGSVNSPMPLISGDRHGPSQTARSIVAWSSTQTR